MAGMSVHVQRDIRAPLHVVWQVITDLDGAAETLTGIEKVERLEGEGYDVGVRWRETRTMFGKEATEEMWVAAVDAPHSTTVVAESHGTRYTTVFTCEPSASGTLLNIDFAGIPARPSLGQKLAGAVFGAIGRKASQKALEKDLDDIATAAQARSEA